MRESIKLIKQSIKLRKQASPQASPSTLPPLSFHPLSLQRVAQWTTSFNRMGAAAGKKEQRKKEGELKGKQPNRAKANRKRKQCSGRTVGRGRRGVMDCHLNFVQTGRKTVKA